MYVVVAKIRHSSDNVQDQLIIGSFPQEASHPLNPLWVAPAATMQSKFSRNTPSHACVGDFPIRIQAPINYIGLTKNVNLVIIRSEQAAAEKHTRLTRRMRGNL